MYQDDDARLAPRSSVSTEAGFTLVEVLVALVIVLIGAYAALNLFPAGFAAIERSRQQSVAASLAEREIQHWRLAAASLPEAIVWADSSSGSLIYRTSYDPTDLRPNAANPNWQPDSVYHPRTIIGEMLPVGDVTVDLGGGVSAIRVPLCRLHYGPLEHLYDNPADGDPLFIYTTEYQRADRADALDYNKDWGRYYINYDAGAISLDRAAYERRFRVEFTYLTATGVGAEVRYEMTDTTQMITVPAGWDSRPTGTSVGQGPLSLWLTTAIIVASPAGAVRSTNVVTVTTTAAHGFSVGQKVIIAGVTGVGLTDFNGTFTITGATPTAFTYDQTEADDTGGGGTAGPLPADFAGVVPLNERVHQAFIRDTVGSATWTAGHFDLSGDISDPSAALLFHPDDAGRTVNVDYRVRDWQILAEEQEPDPALRLRLAVRPLKSPQYINRPRQPNPDRIIPTDTATVIVLDTQTGAQLDATKLSIDYNGGVISNRAGASPAQVVAGRTYRIYSRGKLDWTVQPMKAAADYAVLVGGAPPIGYRGALWAQGTNTLQFGRSEVGKSVLAGYHYDSGGGPRLVSGELRQVTAQGDYGVARLARVPGAGGIRVEGASTRVRVLWAGRGRTQAVGGELSPERWNQAPVETFLRRP